MIFRRLVNIKIWTISNSRHGLKRSRFLEKEDPFFKKKEDLLFLKKVFSNMEHIRFKM